MAETEWSAMVEAALSQHDKLLRELERWQRDQGKRLSALERPRHPDPAEGAVSMADAALERLGEATPINAAQTSHLAYTIRAPEARCSLCGCARVKQDDGTLGACSALDCKDPLRDCRAPEAAAPAPGVTREEGDDGALRMCALGNGDTLSMRSVRRAARALLARIDAEAPVADLDLDELEQLHKASLVASPMPWSAHRVGDQWTVRDAPVPDSGFPDGCLLAEITRSRLGYSCPEDHANAALIAALRNAAPALLSAAREGERLRGLLLEARSELGCALSVRAKELITEITNAVEEA